MSAALIDVDGTPRVLDGRSEPEEIVTETDAQDPAKVARHLSRALKLIAELRRRANPRRTDFEGVIVDMGGLAVSLQHNFGGRIRWWPVGWQSASATVAPSLVEDTTSTTDSTLVLRSYAPGTVTIRIEEAG